MNTLKVAMDELSNASQAMQLYAEDNVVQERYRAAIEVYRHKIELQSNLAHDFLIKHQAVNDKIFKEAIEYLDIAVEYANIELAESALKLINDICAEHGGGGHFHAAVCELDEPPEEARTIMEETCKRFLNA